MTDSAYTGPLCGEEDCQLCPTQADMDEYHRHQEDDARRIARYMLGLPEVAE